MRLGRVLGMAIVGVGMTGVLAGAQTTFTADPVTLGPIPPGPDPGGGLCSVVPGPPRDVAFDVTGITGPVVPRVSATLTHQYSGDVTATLIAPDGTAHLLFGRIGASADSGGGDPMFGYAAQFNGTYEFSDAGSNLWAAAASLFGTIAPGHYRTHVLGGAGSTGAATSMNAVLLQTPPNGTWTLRLTDICSSDVGSVSAASLTLTPLGLTAVADTETVAYQGSVTVGAPGVLANDTAAATLQTAQLASTPQHGGVVLVSNGGFTYTPAPGFVGQDSFTYIAGVHGVMSAPATVTITVQPPTIVPTPDTYATAYLTPLTVAASGVLANDTASAGPIVAALESAPQHGTLTLNASGAFVYTPDAAFAGADSFTYRPVVGPVAGAATTVTIDVAPPTDVQAPLELKVVAIEDGVATVRWRPFPVGPAATSYLIQGGVAPGAVLGSLTLPALPFADLTLPRGTYFLRVLARNGSQTSAPSNEVRLVIGGGMTPSAPTGLTAMVSGTTVAFAWTSTFAGGEPDAVVLAVSGSATATQTVDAGESVTFAGAPPGSYTVVAHALNAAGTSAPSSPVTVAVPAACSGAPAAPANVAAGMLNGRLRLVFDPPPTGAAPQGYELDVTGAWTGTFALPGRTMAATPPPGVYTLAIRAVNSCGSSAPTAPVTVTVP